MNTLSIPDRPFTTSELPGLGLSKRQVREAIEEGLLRRVLRGTYAPHHLEDSPALRAICAGLVLSPHHVLCDRGAAWLHGVPCYEPDALDVQPRLDVVAIRDADRSRRPELLGGTRDLLANEIVTIGGLQVTSPLRTACDVACLRGRSRALATLDGFSRLYALTDTDFAGILPRYRGRRGSRQLRQLLPLIDPLAESPGESWTRLAISDAGLPVPTSQVWVHLDGFGSARLDHAYEHLKIGVEFDGEEFHGEDQRGHDERRRLAFHRAGWVIIVVTKRDFAGARLQLWLARLRDEIAERTPSGRRDYSRTPGAWTRP